MNNQGSMLGKTFTLSNTAFPLFQFFSGRYTILRNSVKNSVFQTMQQYYLVPIVEKFSHSSKEV